MTNYSKHLVLFWKWQHLLADPNKTETILVEGAEAARIHLLHEDMGAAGLAAWLETILLDESECLVLLHNAKMPVQDLLPLQQKYEERPHLRFERFGGGKSYLYYSLNSNTGLIDQQGAWASAALFETSDGRDVTPALFHESGTLYNRYFEPVWQYYRHHFKRRLYERKVRLLRMLMGQLAAGKTFYTAEVLASNPELDAEFRDLFSLAEEVYHQNKTLTHSMEKLKQRLKQKSGQSAIKTEADLQALNQLFLQVLDALPEPIY